MVRVQVLVSFMGLVSAVTAISPVIDLQYSKYQGVRLQNGITQWLGIRYAAPPVGDLRFAPPQSPPQEEALQDADTPGKLCLETGAKPSVTKTSEDCLFLNVFTPSNATAESNLPVFFYILGGGFNKLSNPNINGSGLIAASDYNMVIVSFNYRVGLYGFASNGAEITANNGLRDQRFAMEWVQRHISKFGGNPDHVVIGGPSAGAASVALHLTANDGTNLNLFHAAAGESPSFATILTVEQAKYQYKNLATRLGCAGAHSLACLRNKTAKEVQAENFNIPFPGGANPPTYLWTPVLDNDIVTDYTYRAFAQGKFVKVPTIFGDDTNGGTTFAPRSASTLAESNQFVLDSYPFLELEQFEDINRLYPNPNQTCPDEGCYWRQTANVYGEVRYMCPAYFMASTIANHGVASSYAYQWNVEDPGQVAAGMGVPHTVEVGALWGPEYISKAPDSYKAGGINAKASPVIQGYWTGFITDFDPNKRRYGNSTEWTTATSTLQDRLMFGTGGTTAMVPLDSGLKERCEYWAEYGVAMAQ